MKSSTLRKSAWVSSTEMFGVSRNQMQKIGDNMYATTSATAANGTPRGGQPGGPFTTDSFAFTIGLQH